MKDKILILIFVAMFIPSAVSGEYEKFDEETKKQLLLETKRFKNRKFFIKDTFQEIIKWPPTNSSTYKKYYSKGVLAFRVGEKYPFGSDYYPYYTTSYSYSYPSKYSRRSSRYQDTSTFFYKSNSGIKKKILSLKKGDKITLYGKLRTYSSIMKSRYITKSDTKYIFMIKDIKWKWDWDENMRPIKKDKKSDKKDRKSDKK
jgi:hypothetical protein